MKTLIFLLYPVIVIAIKYEGIVTNERIVAPCKEYPNVSLDKILSLADLDYKTLDNGGVHFKGVVKIIVDMRENDTITTNMEMYRKRRGNWISTIYSITRADSCKALFSKNELWYKYVKDIPEKQRKCPFKTGMEFDVDAKTDFEFELPDKSFEGEYKLRFLHHYNSDRSIFTCYEIYLDFYRV